MEQKPLKVKWTPKAVKALDIVHEFYAAKSADAANKVVSGIIETASSIVFPEQYQFDEIDIEGRRMIYRYFKIFYELHHGEIFIINIIDTRMNPSKNIETIDD